MADLLPPDEASALRYFCHLCAEIYAATSDASFVGGSAQTASDNARKERTQALTLTAIKTLTLLETVLPLTRFTYLLHVLIHVPEYIHRWNHVRNFWCFFMERYDVYTYIHHFLYDSLCPIHAHIVPNVDPYCAQCIPNVYLSQAHGFYEGLCDQSL